MSEFGVYVHIPFCRHRCDYCAFATWTDKDDIMESYVQAVIADIERKVADGMPVADTVFFGGGTPTRLDPQLLASIVKAIRCHARDDARVCGCWSESHQHGRAIHGDVCAESVKSYS